MDADGKQMKQIAHIISRQMTKGGVLCHLFERGNSHAINKKKKWHIR